jgi:rare lipoprotein A
MRPCPSFRWWLSALGLVVLSGLHGCAGPSREVSYPAGYPIGYTERGVASWYGPGFHGNKTANGERFDMRRFTAAHRTLPLGSVATVRSLATGKTVTVRINDRGPFARGRILDLSQAAAERLDMIGTGTAQVELTVVGFEGRPGAFGLLRLQVGSFVDPANAQALAARLRQSFPDVRVSPIEVPPGHRYRVQVGQFRSEAEAEAAAARLQSEFDLESLILRDDV